MLVNAQKMKHLRLSRNWTQQHLADVCGLSMRTIQRVEKDAVASNETVAAYAAVFEIDAASILISVEEFDNTNRSNENSAMSRKLGSVIFVGGFLAGILAGTSLMFWMLP